MTADPRRRRFPPVLADKLSRALHATRPLGDRRLELLAVYRENNRRAIAERGLDADFKGIGDGIPTEWVRPIMELHDAFADLHKYREPGGADDYMAYDVYRESQQLTATQKRITENQRRLQELLIAEYIPARHGTKGKIKNRLCLQFSVSERYLDGVIKKLKESISQ